MSAGVGFGKLEFAITGRRAVYNQQIRLEFFTGDIHIDLAYITPFQVHGNITRLRGTAVLDTEIPVVQTYICKF